MKFLRRHLALLTCFSVAIVVGCKSRDEHNRQSAAMHLAVATDGLRLANTRLAEFVTATEKRERNAAKSSLDDLKNLVPEFKSKLARLEKNHPWETVNGCDNAIMALFTAFEYVGFGEMEKILSLLENANPTPQEDEQMAIARKAIVDSVMRRILEAKTAADSLKSEVLIKD